MTSRGITIATSLVFTYVPHAHVFMKNSYEKSTM